jgi:hypothetical protein
MENSLSVLPSAKIVFISLGFVLLSCGYFSGMGKATSLRPWTFLLGIGTTIFLAVRSFRGYKYFADQFAMAIYRDFLTSQDIDEDAAKE